MTTYKRNPKEGQELMQTGHDGRRLSAIVAMIACLAALGGCGDEDKKQDASTTAAKPAATGGTIEDQLGFTRKGIAAASAKVENSIATCMKAEGFDYIPVDIVAQQAALTGKANMSDEEYEKQFGYGITTLYGRASAQSDPNEKIRAQLGEADRAAYDRALSGGKPEQTFVFAVDTGEFTELGGCTKKATDAVFGGTRLLQTLQRKLDELDDSIVNDQRVVRALDAWRACVKKATGEEYEDDESIEEEITDRFKEIVGGVVPPGQVAPADVKVDMEALRKLQRDEIDLFRKAFACEERHVDPVEDKVREEKEALFKSDNAELLRTVKPLGT